MSSTEQSKKMQVNQRKLRPKYRRSKRGVVVCKVYYINHQLTNAFTMYSSEKMDRRGLQYSINHFKNKICNKAPFKGNVNWAEIYIDGQAVTTYKFHDHESEIRTWKRA